MDADALANLYQEVRAELGAYLSRLLVRPALAEEVAQTAYVNALEALEKCPSEVERVRAWLFRIATNLAIDELRRHGNWRENLMLDLRETAESDPAYLTRSREMIGTPETALIAREHLAACFSCVLRRFPEHKAATLLLREVHGFSQEEIAEWLEVTPVQVKNWLQEVRAATEATYADTCALINKQGACHQCAELNGFFRGADSDPLRGTARDTSARLSMLREMRAQPLGPWHRMLFDLLDDIV